MKPELTSLIAISVFTALMWAPYVLNRFIVGGLEATIGYPPKAAELSPWAARLRAAHANAVENLIVFAVLILAAQAAGVSTPVTETAAWLYLWSRLVHAFAYTLGVRWLRTLAFVGGFAAQMMVAWAVVSA